MSFELNAGERQFVEVVSCSPSDSIRDLTRAVAALAAAATDETLVKWSVDPESLDFIFRAKADEAELTVVRYLEPQRGEGEGKAEFSFSGSRFDLCRAFCDSLCELKESAAVDEYASNWRHEFPENELRALLETIKSYEGN